MDQLGFLGVLAAWFANPLNLKGVVTESAKSAEKGVEVLFLKFLELLGKKLAGPIAIFLVMNALILFGFSHAVLSLDSAATAPVWVMYISVMAMVVAAGITWALGKTAPRLVSIFWSTLALLVPLCLSGAYLCIYAIGKGNGWVKGDDSLFLIGCGVLAQGAISFVALGKVLDWIIRKGLKALETAAGLVLEPAAALLPGTTTEDAPVRVRPLVDIFEEEEWGAWVKSVPTVVISAVLPFIFFVSFWLSPTFAKGVAIIGLGSGAGVWYALHKGLITEVRAQERLLALVMLSSAVPRGVVYLIGDATVATFVRGYWNGDTYLIENHGWWIPVLIAPVALIVMMVASKKAKESKSKWTAAVATAAGLIALWSFAAFIIALKDIPGWTLFGKPVTVLIAETDVVTPKTPVPAQTVIVVQQPVPSAKHTAVRHPTHRAPVRVAKSDAEVERDFDDLARDLGVDAK